MPPLSQPPSHHIPLLVLWSPTHLLISWTLPVHHPVQTVQHLMGNHKSTKGNPPRYSDIHVYWWAQAQNLDYSQFTTLQFLIYLWIMYLILNNHLLIENLVSRTAIWAHLTSIKRFKQCRAFTISSITIAMEKSGVFLLLCIIWRAKMVGVCTVSNFWTFFGHPIRKQLWR